MKNSIVQPAIYVGVLVLAIVGTALAGNPTPVTTCGTVITAPGTYTLADDLTNCFTAVTIDASSVTLLLNGHTISGAGPYPNSDDGIVIGPCCAALTNVTGPGVITNFAGAGITFGAASASVAQNITVTGCGQGFTLSSGATNNQLIGNTATGNHADGFVTGTGNVFKGNTSNGNTTGFLVGSDNTVRGNTANNNATDGIVVGASFLKNTISYNTALGNNTSGGTYYDFEDDNTPNCRSNIWKYNVFGTANQSCIH